MNLWQSEVENFHRRTGQKTTSVPGEMDEAARVLRAKLIMEEAVETVAALGFTAEAEIYEPTEGKKNSPLVAHFFKKYETFNLHDYIDGLCDLAYVTLGGAAAANIDLDIHFNEVHRANMRKLDGPKREDGKQLKPEGWEGPNHERLIERARGNYDHRVRAAADGL